MRQTLNWSAHLSAIEAEGISTQAYARREGLSAASLYYWRKRLKYGVKQGDTPAPQLVAVQLNAPTTEPHCTMWLASGVRLELSALPPAHWLAQVVGAVSQRVR